jgi:uncharacterized RDD family membrane protein YckC
VPYASWGLRVGGYPIDTAVFLVVLGALLLLFRQSRTLDVRMTARHGRGRRHISVVPFLVTGVFYVGYGTLLCGSPRGQTLGLAFFVLGLIWLLGMLFPLWDRKRQTLHDKVAGSVVLPLRAAG